MRRESVASLRVHNRYPEWGLRGVPVKDGKTRDIPLPAAINDWSDSTDTRMGCGGSIASAGSILSGPDPAARDVVANAGLLLRPRVQSSQTRSADHHDVVKAFSPNRANDPLGIRVLPRRARRNDYFSDAQPLGLTRKSFSVNLIAIPNQVPGPLLQRACLEQLACSPFRRRMVGDIEMHQPAPPVGQD